MPHVPDDPVYGSVENAMQCNGKFDCAEVGGEVSSVDGDPLYDKLPQFSGKQFKVFRFEELQVFGRCYALNVHRRSPFRSLLMLHSIIIAQLFVFYRSNKKISPIPEPPPKET
jgi:hypothetical protein